MIYAIIGVVAVIVIYFFVQYNIFVKQRNNVNEAFSTMDVYLKKRWDLIPNLVETVKGYAGHESSVLEEVTKFRSRIYDNLSNNEKIDTNNQIANDIPRIMAIAESYPELKANENFQNLSKQLVQVEDEIANSRKYYNAVVKKLNTQIEMFPSSIVALICRVNKEKMFTIGEEERKNISIKDSELNGKE